MELTINLELVDDGGAVRAWIEDPDDAFGPPVSEVTAHTAMGATMRLLATLDLAVWNGIEDELVTEAEVASCDECSARFDAGGNDHCAGCGNCTRHCAGYVDCPSEVDADERARVAQQQDYTTGLGV